MENHALNLSKVSPETERIIDYFVKLFSKEDLDFLSSKRDNKLLSFKSQLLIRYQYKYPLMNLDEIKNQLYLLSFFEERNDNDADSVKKEIFEELDQFFTDKKPNKFLDLCKENQAIIAALIGAFVAILIAIIK